MPEVTPPQGPSDGDRFTDYLNAPTTEPASTLTMARVFVGGTILLVMAVIVAVTLALSVNAISSRSSLLVVMGFFGVFVLTPTAITIGVWAFKINVFARQEKQ